ncbi:oxygenase MpaB family protein [Actinomadura sp. NTSP31]|uniref:oxygenase MpaB family protein n=1 Tax=Actinomadura sp. NTSP31 TaxID=1735447 RepID=UPI0035C1AFCD
MVDAVQTLSGRHDQASVYAGPAGDPGLCGPGSVSWVVNGDLGAVAMAGVAAIVLEILHPSVIAGVQDHSSYRQDPFRRGRTTMGYVLGTTFGNTRAATRLIDGVKKVHGQVAGTRPDGTGYRALDPALLAWVHTCIPWMIMTAYERFNRPLTPRTRDRYLAEQAVIGRMAGADAVPETMDELAGLVSRVRPELAVTEQTRDFLEFLMTPQLPQQSPFDVPLQRFYVRAGMSLAPPWARRLTGLDHPVGAARLLDGSYLRTHARLIRWAFQVPPYLAMARARTAGVQA